MRSSALGEDAQEASFAGQYRSILNVSPEYLILSYKEIVASKYSVPAMTYRLNKGFLDEEIVMCVGCMAMIEAGSGGSHVLHRSWGHRSSGNSHQCRLGPGKIRG